MTRKILALDFDGVIVDSWYDALFCSFNSYCKFKTNLFDKQKFTINNFDELKEKYKKEFEKFRKLRSYIVNEKDYYVILRIIEENVKINNQEEFDEYKNSISIEIPVMYSKIFYDERNKIQSNNYKSWVEKLSPGFNVIDNIRKLQNKYKIVIATANRAKSIYKIFPDFLNLSITLDDIIDDEIVEGKKKKKKSN